MIEIFTDGGSRGNPGKSACAFIVYEEGKLIFSKYFYLNIGTNNSAEYQGLNKALDYVIENKIPDVRIFSDSELMVRQVNKVYKVKEESLKILYNEVDSKIKKISKFEIIHIRREKNKEADLLVNKCLDEN